jgi:hypothetical protein
MLDICGAKSGRLKGDGGCYRAVRNIIKPVVVVGVRLERRLGGGVVACYSFAADDDQPARGIGAELAQVVDHRRAIRLPGIGLSRLSRGLENGGRSRCTGDGSGSKVGLQGAAVGDGGIPQSQRRCDLTSQSSELVEGGFFVGQMDRPVDGDDVGRREVDLACRLPDPVGIHIVFEDPESSGLWSRKTVDFVLPSCRLIDRSEVRGFGSHEVVVGIGVSHAGHPDGGVYSKLLLDRSLSRLDRFWNAHEGCHRACSGTNEAPAADCSGGQARLSVRLGC